MPAWKCTYNLMEISVSIGPFLSIPVYQCRVCLRTLSRDYDRDRGMASLNRGKRDRRKRIPAPRRSSPSPHLPVSLALCTCALVLCPVLAVLRPCPLQFNPVGCTPFRLSPQAFRGPNPVKGHVFVDINRQHVPSQRIYHVLSATCAPVWERVTHTCIPGPDGPATAYHQARHHSNQLCRGRI